MDAKRFKMSSRIQRFFLTMMDKVEIINLLKKWQSGKKIARRYD
jgi:hypothetical protein